MVDDGSRRPDEPGAAAYDTEPTHLATVGDPERTTVLCRADAEGDSGPGGPRSFGRFEVVGTLGRGGMGEVLRVQDPTLDRTLALKLILTGEANLRTRFLHEARAQAKVQHPHVCTVYETGEVDGRLFIAMELLPGRTLAAVAPELDPVEAAGVMQRVAEAVHAAHERGLIHRDLKPTNIIVDRRADGTWWPWVTDFGLARDLESPGVTQSGTTLGTPAYMPPEQARGRLEAVNVRSDVYALGAMLFTVLCGRPPFAAESTAEVLVQVIQDEPPTFASLGVRVPRDLESIVLRCLEKDPERRYPDAASLAEDLGRFLEGRPVTARRVGPAVRAVKWVRRHRLAAAVIASAAVALMVIGGFWWHATARDRTRERLAAEYGDRLRLIEEGVRHTLTAPLHDVRPELEAARAGLATLEERVAADGPVARGPGAAALGWGYLAIGEPEVAHRHLTSAVADGVESARLDAALGHTLAELYRRERAAVATRAEPERSRNLADAVREYRDPALILLEEVRRCETESPEFLEAVLASCDERFEDALTHAEAAARARPWLYDAHLISGDAWRELGRVHMSRGEAEGAMAAFESAESALREAAAIGRSDPTVHQALCDLGLARSELGLFGSGNDLAAVVEAALPACRAVVVADPDRVGGHLGQSALWVRLAEWNLERQQAPEAALGEVERAAGRALELDPDNGEAMSRLGSAAVLRAQHLLGEGGDPTARIAEAVAWFEAASTRDPSRLETIANLGKAHWLTAAFVQEKGGDPREALKRAGTAFERAEDAADPDDPEIAVMSNNAGAVWFRRAMWERDNGHDPGPSLDLAVASFERAAGINPDLVLAPLNMAYMHGYRAGYLAAEGGDPLPWWRAAVAAYHRCLEIQPDHPTALVRLAAVHTARAEHLIATGGDPVGDLDAAVNQLDILHRSREGHPEDTLGLARAVVDRGVWTAGRGEDSGEDLAHVRALLGEVSQHGPEAAGAAEEVAREAAPRWAGVSRVDLRGDR